MITLTQLKHFLSISLSDTSKDEQLNGFIRDAISELNSLTSRRLDYALQTEILDGTGGVTIVLNNYPVTEVEKIEFLCDANWEDLFTAPDDFSNSAVLLKEVGIIKLLKSYVFPKDERNIKVTYSAGYKWAEEWKAETAYSVDEMVRYSNVIYTCKEAHTSGTSFDETKWDTDSAKAVPELLARAVKYLAAKQFYESPAGKNLFMKLSESRGDKQTVYEDIKIDNIINIYRNTNA